MVLKIDFSLFPSNTTHSNDVIDNDQQSTSFFIGQIDEHLKENASLDHEDPGMKVTYGNTHLESLKSIYWTDP